MNVFPKLSVYVSASRPNIVSALSQCDFSSSKLEAAAYPSHEMPVPVRHRLLKEFLASPFGPFIVELFTAADLLRSPGMASPVRIVANLEAPHASTG